jgi:hypothetical protein
MTKARRTEGPRAPLFFSALQIMILGSLANAQPVELSALEICAGLETAELKLVCFEAIIASGNRAAKPVSDTFPPPMAERTPAIAEAAESGSPAATVEPEAKPRPGAVIVTAAGSATVSTPADEFGREHLEKTQNSAEPVPEVLAATVIEVTQGRNRALSFRLANGQVWRQIEPRYFPYPKKGEFDVTISTGMMGEYRLRVGKIGDSGRMVRIRRVR